MRMGQALLRRFLHGGIWRTITPMQLHYIANAGVRSSAERTLPVIDPSDGQPYDAIQRGTPEDIDRAVQAARQCFEGPWGKLSAAERGRLMMRLSLKLSDCVDELAAIE